MTTDLDKLDMEEKEEANQVVNTIEIGCDSVNFILGENSLLILGAVEGEVDNAFVLYLCHEN